MQTSTHLTHKQHRSSLCALPTLSIPSLIQAITNTMIRIAACPKRFCTANKHRQKSYLPALSTYASSLSHLSSSSSSAFAAKTKPLLAFQISSSSSFYSTATRTNPTRTPPSQRAAVSLADALDSSSSSPFLASPHHSSLPPSSLPSYHHPNVVSWEDNVREEDAAWLSGPRPLDWWTGTWRGGEGGREGERWAG